MVRMKSNKELNIMTTQTSNARRFSPIFVATITPGSVATRTDKNGNKYSYLTGATIAQANKESKQMTAMAFRSEERRVGKECVSEGRSRGSPCHKKKNTKT